GEGRGGVAVQGHVCAARRLQLPRRRVQALCRCRVHGRHGRAARAVGLRLHGRRLPRRGAPRLAGSALLMRRSLLVMVLVAVAVFPWGCGGKFELPTERAGGAVPTNQDYKMLATWTGMDSIQDLLLTQGQGDQLFALF